jgi:hypothetical protein
MQSRLLAVPAPGGEKPRHPQHRTGTGRLQPLRRRPHGNNLDLALDTPWTTRFQLFRSMPDQAFDDRHTGRCETQGLAFDQDAL